MATNPFESPKAQEDSFRAAFDVRRQELSPQVRSYVDTLYVQIRQIFDKYGVANIEDLRDGVKSKQIKMESKDGEKLKDLTRWLRDTLKEKKIPKEALLKVLESIFGQDNLEEVKIPDPTELTPEYFDRMYPKKQRPEDEKRGLVSFRPDRWDETAYSKIVSPKETWGDAYFRSMKHEAQELFATSSLILVESIQKPNHIDYNDQYYGSKEGKDPSLDPLLPLFKKALGAGAIRFDNSWDDFNDKLLPMVKAKIEQTFKDQGLSVPAFEVILVPALVFNRQTTEQHPENSSTNTRELSSTVLLTWDSKDDGYRLSVGSSVIGGAGFVREMHRSDRNKRMGARLAVVFKK